MFKNKQNNDNDNKNVKIKSNLSSACIQKMISVVGSNQSLNLISAISHKIINRLLIFKFYWFIVTFFFYFLLALDIKLLKKFSKLIYNLE